MAAVQGVLIVTNWGPRSDPHGAPADLRFMLEDEPTGPRKDGEADQINEFVSQCDRGPRRCVLLACACRDRMSANIANVHMPILLVESKALTHGQACQLHDVYGYGPQGMNSEHCTYSRGEGRRSNVKHDCLGVASSLCQTCKEPAKKKTRGSRGTNLNEQNCGCGSVSLQGKNHINVPPRRLNKKSPEGGGASTGASALFLSFAMWLPGMLLPEVLGRKSKCTVSALLPNASFRDLGQGDGTEVVEAALLCCSAFLSQKNLAVQSWITRMAIHTVVEFKVILATTCIGAECDLHDKRRLRLRCFLNNIDAKLLMLNDAERLANVELEAIRCKRTRHKRIYSHLDYINDEDRLRLTELHCFSSSQQGIPRSALHRCEALDALRKVLERCEYLREYVDMTMECVSSSTDQVSLLCECHVLFARVKDHLNKCPPLERQVRSSQFLAEHKDHIVNAMNCVLRTIVATPMSALAVSQMNRSAVIQIGEAATSFSPVQEARYEPDQDVGQRINTEPDLGAMGGSIGRVQGGD